MLSHRSADVLVATVSTCSRANQSSPTTSSRLERFRWEGPRRSTPGKHTIVFDFKYDGPGMAKGGTGVLSVDGKEVAKKTIPHTVPALLTIDESFDVGVDTRTGVDDKDYQPPFRFTGKLDKLTIKLEPKRTAAEERLLEETKQLSETRHNDPVMKLAAKQPAPNRPTPPYGNDAREKPRGYFGPTKPDGVKRMATGFKPIRRKAGSRSCASTARSNRSLRRSGARVRSSW